MISLKVKILKDNAVVPTFAQQGDAGLDLTATSKEEEFYSDLGITCITYGTGLALEIPEGQFGLLCPRSSVYKTGLILANTVGIIDSGYRGELTVKFYKNSPFVKAYNVGDRIAQLILLPVSEIGITVVPNLSSSARGTGGFGSTGGAGVNF